MSAPEDKEFRAVLDAFAGERDLRDEVFAPPDPAEEADPTYQRMQQAAAAASDRLRAELLPPAPRARHRLGWWLAAVAVVVVALVFAFRSDRPGLMPDVPDQRVLGGLGRIQLSSELHVAHPVLTWIAVPNARTYEAVIEGPAGVELLRRDEAHATSLQWSLEPAELAALATSERLILRIVARDGTGLPVATTGDLPITLHR